MTPSRRAELKDAIEYLRNKLIDTNRNDAWSGAFNTYCLRYGTQDVLDKASDAELQQLAQEIDADLKAAHRALLNGGIVLTRGEARLAMGWYRFARNWDKHEPESTKCTELVARLRKAVEQ